MGTEASVAAITIDEMKAFYASNFSPTVTHITVVGDITRGGALNVFQALEKWEQKEVRLPVLATPPTLKKSKLYFVDFPNAKQSQIRIGNPGLTYTDPDYYKATVMNYKLGGSFNGFLNLILREEKGYTYGARSNFSGTHYPGTFVASAGVRSTATFESVEIFKDELTKYRKGLSDEDLQFTKDALIKSNARRFETLGALMGMLDQIATYDLPDDYVKNRETIVREITKVSHRQLAQKYIDPDKMVFLVVGDAKTQMRQLSRLGLGKTNLIDKDGNPVK